MAYIIFPIVSDCKLYLVDRNVEIVQTSAFVISTEGKITCMYHTDDYLMAIQDTGNIILIRNMQSKSEAEITQIDTSKYNFDKVYCNNNGQFFAVDNNGQLHHIIYNDVLKITKLDSHDIKVIDMTFDDTPYILTDDNKIFQLSMNIFTGQLKIINDVNIPEHVRAIGLKFTRNKKYLFDDKGDIYMSQYVEDTYEWIMDEKVHNIVGSYFSEFDSKLLIIDTLGRLVDCSYDHPQIFGLPLLKEISGIKNYYIAKDDTGRLNIANCTSYPPDVYSFELASISN